MIGQRLLQVESYSDEQYPLILHQLELRYRTHPAVGTNCNHAKLQHHGIDIESVEVDPDWFVIFVILSNFCVV